MDNRMKFNLQTKIIILVISVVFTITFILMIRNFSQERIFIQKIMRENAIILSSAFNVTISTFKDLENHQKIQENIYRYLILHPDLIKISVSIITPEGLKIIASSQTDQIGQYFQIEKEIENNLVITDDFEFLNVINPLIISGQKVGFYNMYFSLESENIFIAQRKRESILILFFSVFLTSTALFYSLKKILISPIFKIEKGIKLIGEGDLKYKIKINRSDEIGNLADGVNEMCNKIKISHQEMELKIKERTKELQDLRNTLEKEVELRTKELKKKIDELEEFNELAVGREIRIVELKKEIEKLKKQNNLN